MIEKVKNYIICFLFGALLICTGVAAKNRRELGEARLELERVRIDALALAERQRAIDGNIERAREIVERQQASVSSSLATVQDIRACIAKIRTYTATLEKCLRDYDINNSANNNSSGGGSGE